MYYTKIASNKTNILKPVLEQYQKTLMEKREIYEKSYNLAKNMRSKIILNSYKPQA